MLNTQRKKSFFRINTFIYILCFISLLAQAQDKHAENWNKANNYFMQKEYDSALDYFQKIQANAFNSAPLYYNIGNCYFYLDSIGQSILNYEKALKFEPNNKLIKDNLSIAKTKIINPLQQSEKVFFLLWYEKLLAWFSLNVWAIFLFLSFSTSLFIIYISKRNKINYKGRWIATSIIIFFIMGIITFTKYRNQYNVAYAIVTQKQSILLFENKPTAKIILNEIPEGSKLKLLTQSNQYTKVELPDGRSGWVLSTTITPF